MGGLTVLSILYIAMSYTAGAIFLIGTLYKVYGYASTPSPLKIPITPQPTTFSGVVAENALNIGLFSSLFKGNRWTWVGGYGLHVILLLILLRHLRFFLEPVTGIVLFSQWFGMWAGYLFPLPLLYLLVRRGAVDRVKYITSVADSFFLLLLLAIGLSGISLKLLTHTDLIAIKQFLLGLILFSPVNIPPYPFFLLHFTLVLTLAVYFPFSKLLHAGGVFFSPTKTQIDNPREIKHINPWSPDNGI
ncbi:MAG: respiratory nitrate reductase subunit gamma [Nitrospinota bacterium]